MIRKMSGVEEFEDVGTTFNSSTVKVKGGRKVFGQAIEALKQVENNLSKKEDKKMGATTSEVKSMLAKLGVTPKAPKDIEWDNPEVVAKLFDSITRTGKVPEVWENLGMADLNAKLDRLVKTHMKVPMNDQKAPAKEVKKPKYEMVDGDTPEIVDEEFEEPEEGIIQKRKEKKIDRKLRKQHAVSKAEVVRSSNEARQEMNAISGAEYLAFLSEFEDKDGKIHKVLNLQTQRNGRGKLIFRGGASKFLRLVKFIFGDHMDVVAADDDTAEFMAKVQQEIIAIVKRNQ